ncbi:MAG: prepilin peptidase [Proteobacteria bacterium]|nr:prepilin peptidase [Pseudomonadota bacterium]
MVGLFIAALMGLVFGSFATMASYRLVMEEPFVGRSQCPNCKTQLKVRSLVPVLSYVAQRGRCANCSEPIALRYPLLELLTCAAFVGIAYANITLYQAICLYIAALLLVILIAVDIEALIIPDTLQLGLMLVGVYYAFLSGRGLLEVMGTAIFSFLLGCLLYYGSKIMIKKEGLGWGDVKFFAVAGLFLNIELLAPFFFISGIIGILTALIWKAYSTEPEFPFGPALAISLYVCTVWPAVTDLIPFMSPQ